MASVMQEIIFGLASEALVSFTGLCSDGDGFSKHRGQEDIPVYGKDQQSAGRHGDRLF